MYAQLTCTGLIPADAGKTSRFGDFGGGLPVHPRSRRENLTENTRAGIEAGASPLTRGKQGYRVIDGVGVGIIPAHAGKTRRSSSGSRIRPDHPRSRGENAYQSRARDIFKGSSPLTRGKRSCLASFTLSEGIIPAHAGKTTSPWPARPQ